jgi:hypothetical protein
MAKTADLIEYKRIKLARKDLEITFTVPKENSNVTLVERRGAR